MVNNDKIIINGSLAREYRVPYLNSTIDLCQGSMKDRFKQFFYVKIGPAASTGAHFTAFLTHYITQIHWIYIYVSTSC